MGQGSLRPIETGKVIGKHPEESELNRLTTIPNWFLSFLAIVVTITLCSVVPFAYNIGTDLAAIKTSLATCVDRLVEQDAVNDRQDRELSGIRDRVTRVEERVKP